MIRPRRLALTGAVVPIGVMLGLAIHFATKLPIKPSISIIVCCDESWFNSSYSYAIWDIERAINDRWQVGNHSYFTRDLMGRRI